MKDPPWTNKLQTNQKTTFVFEFVEEFEKGEMPLQIETDCSEIWLFDFFLKVCSIFLQKYSCKAWNVLVRHNGHKRCVLQLLVYYFLSTLKYVILNKYGITHVILIVKEDES